jgi:hypothetical protein
MVAEHPAHHRDFLRAYIGAGEVAPWDGGIVAHTENANIEILEPSAVVDLVGFPVKASGQGLTLNAMRFAVADLAGTEALHRQNGLAVRRHWERLIVPPDEAFGATLIFEAAKEG